MVKCLITDTDIGKVLVYKDEQGLSWRTIRKKIKKTVSHEALRQAYLRYKAHQTLKRQKGQGRPPKLSKRSVSRLIRTSLKNRRLTSTQLRDEVPSVSKSTVRSLLNKAGLFGRLAARKPLLTKKNIRDRLEFARRYRMWTSEDWRRVAFSDESQFEIYSSHDRVYIRRRVGERLRPDCLQPTVKFGGGTCMVWGMIHYLFLIPLVKIDGRMCSEDYIELLKHSVIPFTDEIDIVYLQDTAPQHRSNITVDFLNKKNVDFITLPGTVPI